MELSGHGTYCVGKVLITNSISQSDIRLLGFFYFFYVNFDRLYYLSNLFVSLVKIGIILGR